MVPGECDWSTALLEPKLPFGTASFVEFLIMEQPTNLKNCNMLFGITVSSVHNLPFSRKVRLSSRVQEETHVISLKSA